jgi:hypothetical protein
VFQDLPESRAIGKDHSSDIHIIRSDLALSIQAPILVTLGVNVLASRLPTALGRCNRCTHDLEQRPQRSLRARSR